MNPGAWLTSVNALSSGRLARACSASLRRATRLASASRVASAMAAINAPSQNVKPDVPCCKFHCFAMVQIDMLSMHALVVFTVLDSTNTLMHALILVYCRCVCMGRAMSACLVMRRKMADLS